MTRVLIAVACTGCVTSAAAIAIAKGASAGSLKIFNEGFVFMGLIGCCFRSNARAPTPLPCHLPTTRAKSLFG